MLDSDFKKSSVQGHLHVQHGIHTTQLNNYKALLSTRKSLFSDTAVSKVPLTVILNCTFQVALDVWDDPV